LTYPRTYKFEVLITQMQYPKKTDKQICKISRQKREDLTKSKPYYYVNYK